MRRSSSSPALASLSAGPVFLVSTALAAVYLQLPRPVPVALGFGEIVLIVLAFIPAILFGLALSLLPIMLGSRLLLSAGEAFPAARARLVWIGTGALAGVALAWSMTGFAAPALDFGLISTSACCAGICRLSACWD